MNTRAFYIWEIDRDTENVKVKAVFVDEPMAPCEQRANEVLERLRASNKDDMIDFELVETIANGSDQAIGLEPTLKDYGAERVDEIVRLADLELEVHGEMFAPLWCSASWLAHELKARYNRSVSVRNRHIKMINPEMSVVGCSDASNFEQQLSAVERGDADDAGFVETP